MLTVSRGKVTASPQPELDIEIMLYNLMYSYRYPHTTDVISWKIMHIVQVHHLELLTFQLTLYCKAYVRYFWLNLCDQVDISRLSVICPR